MNIENDPSKIKMSSNCNINSHDRYFSLPILIDIKTENVLYT